MNALRVPPAAATDAVHPAVLSRRIQELAVLAAAGLLAGALALAIILALPHASARDIVLVLGAIAGALAVGALIVSSRLEITVLVLTLFLLLLYGPIKLGLGGGQLAHGTDTVMVSAVAFGALLRLVVRRGAIQAPPLLPLVLAFVATVVVEAFNPRTGGLLKVLGGFRQQLQWVPFFFFGYLLVRSKRRFRQVILILGVCALANAVVAAYQTGLSPGQLATWGPGYRELFQPRSVGERGGQARTFSAKGESHVRPIGLGSDSGFSGGLGLVALPLCLAFVATSRGRRRWLGVALALGAAIGVATGLGRLQVVGAVLSLLFFFGLAAIGGRIRRPLAAFLVVVAVAVPVGAVLIPIFPTGTFSRYASFEKNSPTTTATHKAGGYTNIPTFLTHNAFGLGLGTTGPVGGFGGQSTEQQNAGGASAETQYNFLADEVGAPGLIVWIVLLLYVSLLVARRIRSVLDPDLAIYLAAAFGPFIALIFIGLSGPYLTSAALGTWFWFVIGIAAYWLAGSRPRALSRTAPALA